MGFKNLVEVGGDAVIDHEYEMNTCGVLSSIPSRHKQKLYYWAICIIYPSTYFLPAVQIQKQHHKQFPKHADEEDQIAVACCGAQR